MRGGRRRTQKGRVVSQTRLRDNDGSAQCFESEERGLDDALDVGRVLEVKKLPLHPPARIRRVDQVAVDIDVREAIVPRTERGEERVVALDHVGAGCEVVRVVCLRERREGRNALLLGKKRCHPLQERKRRSDAPPGTCLQSTRGLRDRKSV